MTYQKEQKATNLKVQNKILWKKCSKELTILNHSYLENVVTITTTRKEIEPAHLQAIEYWGIGIDGQTSSNSGNELII